MGDLIAPGGVLVLSGILEEQIEEMVTKISEHGLRVIEQRMINDWAAIVVQK
jgi:ribosomal protein L11 methyltransferase